MRGCQTQAWRTRKYGDYRTLKVHMNRSKDKHRNKKVLQYLRKAVAKGLEGARRTRGRGVAGMQAAAQESVIAAVVTLAGCTATVAAALCTALLAGALGIAAAGLLAAADNVPAGCGD